MRLPESSDLSSRRACLLLLGSNITIVNRRSQTSAVMPRLRDSGRLYSSQLTGDVIKGLILLLKYSLCLMSVRRVF